MPRYHIDLDVIPLSTLRGLPTVRNTVTLASAGAAKRLARAMIRTAMEEGRNMVGASITSGDNSHRFTLAHHAIPGKPPPPWE